MKIKTFVHSTTNNATCVGFLSATRLVTAGYGTGGLRTWDVDSGAAVGSPMALTGGAECIKVANGIAYIGLENGEVVTTAGVKFQTNLGRLVEIAVHGDKIAVGSSVSGACRVGMFTLAGSAIWPAVAVSSIPQGLAFSADGAVLFVGTQDVGGGIVARRSAATGNVLSSRMAAPRPINDLAGFGNELAVANENSGGAINCVRFLDGATLNQTGEFVTNFKSGVWSIAYSTDGTRLAVAEVGDMVADTHRVMVIERSSGQVLYSHTRLGVLPKKVAWHPTHDDLFAAAWADGVVELYDLQPNPVTTPPTTTDPSKPGGKKPHK